MRHGKRRHGSGAAIVAKRVEVEVMRLWAVTHDVGIRDLKVSMEKTSAVLMMHAVSHENLSDGDQVLMTHMVLSTFDGWNAIVH
ncbi:hypothetical protein ANO11243_067280 [Dothideomycetidae sp. 11243]|nr:hypothetical protein ANO11243_067280 [fungal sp. No.11243]